jgi:hypothetical protein
MDSYEGNTPKAEKRLSKPFRSRNVSVDYASPEVGKAISRKVSMNAVMAAIRIGEKRRSVSSSSTPVNRYEDAARSEPDMLKNDSSTVIGSALSVRSPLELSADVIHEEGDVHSLHSSRTNSSSPSRRPSALDSNGSGALKTGSERVSSSRRTSARVSKLPGLTGFFALEEDRVTSAPDLSLPIKRGSIQENSNISSANDSSPIKNIFEDSDEEKEWRQSTVRKSESLADILSDKSFVPQTSRGSVHKSQTFKTGAMKLMEEIPKMISITVDRGFVMISEINIYDESENSKSSVLYRISHGSCLALLSNRDKSFEIIHKNGRVRVLAKSIEETVDVVCEINTANSKAAAQRGMSSTFDKPRVSEGNVESYRSAMKSLRAALEFPNLEDIVSMSEIEYAHPPSPVGMNFKLSQTSLLAGSQSKLVENRGYEIASKEEEAKYRISVTHDDITDKLSVLLSADDVVNPEKLPGILMKHLSNSSLEMIVKYELNPDGTFTHAIGAATLEKLVERLADEEKTDTAFNNIFLHTFRHYTNVEEVLGMLRRRMNVKAPDDATAGELQFTDSWASVIKLKYDL